MPLKESVKPYIEVGRSPVLEVTERDVLFNTAAICEYLRSRSSTRVAHQDGAVCDKWASFNDSLALSAVFQSYASAKPSHTELLSVYSTLESVLSLTSYLHGKEVGTSDFNLWATLYPVLMEGGSQQVAPEHVKAWFTTMTSKQSCATASKSLDITKIKGDMLLRPRNCLPPKSAPADVKPKAEGSHESQNLSAAAVTEEEMNVSGTAWNTDNIKIKAKAPFPILPIKNEHNVLITASLPYVNNVPHLGNIIGCVLSADVFARYCRLKGYNTLYICGNDEYGTATETKATQEGCTPQQICDKYNAQHEQIYKWFNCSFDKFGRTTNPLHKEISQELFKEVNECGNICRDAVDQLYCENCSKFLADRFVEGTCPSCKYEDARGDQCDGCGQLINATELVAPRCKQCSATPVIRTSDHLFLDLPKLEPKLTAHLDRAFSRGVWTSNAETITKAWIKGGLKPRCISRDLKWGVSIPLAGYEKKVFYVWFDAPIGYISATAMYTDEWRQWWQQPEQVQLYNFMGKDNVPFHSVIFPSMLLGTKTNWTVVNHMSATEYLNYEDVKFSKSRGVGVFGDQAASTGISSDIWRFYLLYIRPESQDTAFSWDDIATKNNSELLNNLGNFINRALMFISNNFDGVLSNIIMNEEVKTLLSLVNRELKCYHNHLANTRLRDGLRNVLSVSRLGNQYMQAMKPWLLIKGTPDEQSQGHSVTSLCANLSALLMLMLQPYMPVTSTTIKHQLNITSDLLLPEMFVCILQPGHKINKPEPLFSKIEASAVAEFKKQFAGKQVTVVKVESSNDPKELEKQVQDQANKVRELKANKADKPTIKAEVDILLKLKSQLAKLSLTSNDNEETLNKKITDQGNKVRDMKAKKANKDLIKTEVGILLKLKAQLEENTSKSSTENETSLNKKISDQGNKVRILKANKADKPTIKSEVDILLKLKSQLSKLSLTSNDNEETLNKKITDQGNIVRKLKAEKAEKSKITEQVNVLLALKAQLKKKN